MNTCARTLRVDHLCETHSHGLFSSAIDKEATR